MAEKENKYEKIKKETYAIKSYLAKVQDVKNEALKKANEELDYRFEDFKDIDKRKKYGDTFFKHLIEHVKSKYNINDIDEIEALNLAEFYTGITKDEINRIIEQKADKFKPQDITNYMLRNKARFEQSHYQKLARHVETKDDISAALKALDLEDRVESSKIDIADLPELFAMHSGEGIADVDIPAKYRKEKEEKKKKAA